MYVLVGVGLVVVEGLVVLVVAPPAPDALGGGKVELQPWRPSHRDRRLTCLLYQHGLPTNEVYASPSEVLGSASLTLF